MSFWLMVLGCTLIGMELGTSVGIGVFLVAVAIEDAIEKGK